tara:strand:- start:35 stop:505 length:471 start_codon:yes stop_codon:yes gene_type:complete
MKNIDFSLARYLSVQALYQMRFSEQKFENILKQYNEWNIKNIYFDFNDSYNSMNLQVNKEYFNNLLNKYNKEKKLIFLIIEENLLDNWEIQRLPKVLSSIIEVAVSEMFMNPSLSLGIIASEYIILTESFFSKKESSFVNALLENIFNSLTQKKIL